MKKVLKTGLCALAFSVAAALAFGNNIKAPEASTYANENAIKKVERYYELTANGSIEVPRDALNFSKGYNKVIGYLFDRDKDGNVDLVKIVHTQPELKVKDVLGEEQINSYITAVKKQYGEEALKKEFGENYVEGFKNRVTQEKGRQVQLFIDEEFNGGYDGFLERMITDAQNDNGEPLADGKWDHEQYLAPRVEDILKQ